MNEVTRYNMENTNIKISTIQIIMMIIICRLFTSYSYMPILETPPANQDVWVIILLSIIYSLLFAIPLLYLGSKFANISIMNYIELICGKIFGKIIGGLYVLFFFIIAFMQMALLQDFIRTTILIKTPVPVVLFFMAVVCIYLVFMGLEPIARTVEIFLPIIILTITAFFLIAFAEMNFTAFLPVLKESRFADLNFGGSIVGIKFCDMVLLSMLTPHLPKGTNLPKLVITTLIIYSAIFLMMLVSVQATLGIEQAKHAAYPYYTFVQQIKLSEMIQHIEIIAVTSIFFALFIKFSMYLYLTSVALAKTFNFKNNKLSLIPIALVIIVALSWTDIGKDVFLNNIISYKISSYIYLVYILVLPLVLLLVYFLRRKKINIPK